jgi:hypothetical protein
MEALGAEHGDLVLVEIAIGRARQRDRAALAEHAAGVHVAEGEHHLSAQRRRHQRHLWRQRDREAEIERRQRCRRPCASQDTPPPPPAVRRQKVVAKQVSEQNQAAFGIADARTRAHQIGEVRVDRASERCCGRSRPSPWPCCGCRPARWCRCRASSKSRRAVAVEGAIVFLDWRTRARSRSRHSRRCRRSHPPRARSKAGSASRSSCTVRLDRVDVGAGLRGRLLFSP